MKICILHLFSNIATGGEYTYGLHLQSGFRALGHECDIVTFCKSGQELKHFKNKSFKIYKTSERRQVVKQYDYIFILDGYLDDEFDYSFLKNLNIPMCTIEHNAFASYRRYKYDKLFEVVGDIPVVCNSSTGVKAWKEKLNKEIYAVRQPFDVNLLSPPTEKKLSNKLVVCVPHRFACNKHPEIIFNFFNKQIDKKIDWNLHFYGNHNEMVIRWTNLIDELTDECQDRITRGKRIPKIFKDKRVFLFETFNPQDDLPKIFSKTNLTAHATKYRYDGGRMEYTLLESIFYGNPIISYSKNWLAGLDEEMIDSAWVEGKTYIDMNEDRLLQFYNDERFRTLLLDSSKKVIKKYFDAKKIAKKILDIST